MVAFATLYSSSDEEEALLFLVLEDEENSRFVFLSDRCSRSYIIFSHDMQKLFSFRRKKRKWVREINVEHKDFWEFHTQMPELRQDAKRFYIYFRMPSECFDEILSLIKEDITEMDKLSWSYISRRTTCCNTKVNKQHFYISFIVQMKEALLKTLTKT